MRPFGLSTDVFSIRRPGPAAIAPAPMKPKTTLKTTTTA